MLVPIDTTLLLFSASGQTFLTRPKNEAVVVATDPNDYHRFGCSSDLEVIRMDWVEVTQTNDRQLTFNGDLMSVIRDEGYDLDVTDSKYDLIVPSSSIDKAGDYGCRLLAESGETTFAYAKLVMLGKLNMQ